MSLPLPPKALARQREAAGRRDHKSKMVKQNRDQTWDAFKRKATDARSRGSK